MFGLSWEHLLIVGIVLLIFGPRKLPELGSGLGKAIRNFKEGLSGKTGLPGPGDQASLQNRPEQNRQDSLQAPSAAQKTESKEKAPAKSGSDDPSGSA